MRISEHFQVGKSQAELDFVDIDTSTDMPLFLDSHFLACRQDNWSRTATRTIRSFFQHLLDLLSSGRIEDARQVFSHLSEPNETCLGLSKARPQGRGVGPENTQDIFDSLLESRAVETGLLEDLEDCVIMVDNFGRDKLSDMTTNIIRKQLIDYTQAQCDIWSIPLQPGVPSGFFWNPADLRWENEHTQMLVVDSRKILLVPKGIVCFSHGYSQQKYHTHFVLNFLQSEHLRLRSALVQRKLKKNGAIHEFVTKKSVKETESPGKKHDLREFTRKHPAIFENFKNFNKKPKRSLRNEDLIPLRIEEIVDHLISNLRATPAGNDAAGDYHTLIMGILELLFYPSLIAPTKEVRIHQGRKRIDITFDNAADEGLFFELHNLHRLTCPFLIVECKNYSGDPENPELDQLSGRFSPNRGRVGILVCRGISNMNAFLQRCNDTCRDDRGLILPITDDDIIDALEQVKNGNSSPLEETLRNRRRIVQAG